MMKYNSLHDVLKKRYESNSLASLYIIRYDSKFTNPEDWAQEFLSLITTVKNDHPDVLNIKRSEDEKDYKVDGHQWNAFQSFIQYRPYILKNKFVFIYDAHRITEILSNKLLKTFEDSPKQLTIFLFLKDQRPLLPTILSRAISLKINIQKTPLVQKNLGPLLNPGKIIDEIKSLEEGESQFISSVIDQRLENNPTFSQIENCLNSLKSFQKSAEYNNSQASRIALILP
jgi:DNA polymerase III delta prime subunit